MHRSHQNKHCFISYDVIIWASLVAQTVNNLPAKQETWVQSLGWEDALEKVMATQYSCLENPMDRGAHTLDYSIV